MAKGNTSGRNVSQRQQSVGTLVDKALRRRAEKKVVIVGGNSVAVTTGGTVTPLTQSVVQGDDFLQRTGDKIIPMMQLVKTRGVALVASQSIRFILFSDRFNTGTVPAVTDVLSGANFIASYSQLFAVQQKRFRIIRDWTFDCNFAGEAIKSNTFTVPQCAPVFYNGQTNVSTSNGKGALFLLVIGSATSGTYDFNWECTFTDY